jgi:PKD repeat protein
LRYPAVISLCLFLPLAWAGKTVTPTTTLAAERGNNTSGAATFITQSNGNIAPQNVSKMPVRDLMYPGSTSKMYAHFMPWFGGTNHMNVGYRSDDPVQVQRQVTDMISRGIEGAIINWYGPNFSLENATTLAMMREAETRSGQFSFAIMEDGGALKKCSTTAGCDVTQRLIDDLNYAYMTFEQSPAYMRMNGRPLVFFFGVEAYVIDWNRVRNNVLGDPILVQRNGGAFTATQMNGAYGWIAPETVTPVDTLGLTYLDNFLAKSLLYPAQLTFGSAYGGFNDTLASWTKNRVIQQQCGQTWLTTMARTGKYYSVANQLPFMQLVTWNDYEEGTEIETGIDNCVSLTSAMNGTSLNWILNGQENTVDHFTVFISADGVNLMPLADLPSGARSLEISAFDFMPGSYSLYVKAVGKPSLTNKMSEATSFTVQVVRNVNVATPFDGATVASPVRIAASATSSYTVTAMQVYVDGVLAYQGNAASMDTKLTMQPGTRSVSVKAWDSMGGSVMKSMKLNVLANKSPVAMLAVTPTIGTGSVTVAASAAGSYDPDGTLVITKIDFGDGAIMEASAASHTYASPGTYNVKLTVMDDAGAVGTATQSVEVQAPKKYVIIHSPTSTSIPQKVRVSATGYSSVAVQAMQIYVDGQLVHKTLGGFIDKTIVLTKGTHQLTVKGWDISGANFLSSVNVTAN